MIHLKKSFLYSISVFILLMMGNLLSQLHAQVGQTISLKAVATPSPEGSKFTNYFYTPVNTSTGSASIEIPIYNIQVDGVSIPISLSYHTSGIKVTDLSGSVGLGWSLNAGGGIYRNINGLPDDSTGSGRFLSPSFAVGDFHNTSGNIETYNAQYKMDVLANNGHDLNQDDYTYSFLGKSGSIYFDVNHQFQESIRTNTLFSYNNKGLTTLTAKDAGGNSFTFSDKETTETYHITTPMGFPASVSVIGTTAWKLSNITTLNGRSVNFSYSNYTSSILFPSSYSITKKKDPSPGSPPADCYEGSVTYSYTETSITSHNKLISVIESDQVRIEFTYSDHSSASKWKRKLDKIEIKDKITGRSIRTIDLIYSVFSGDARLRLDTVKIKDRELVTSQEYVLRYNSQSLPQVNTLAKDIFGYYNGATTNTTLMKALTIPNVLSNAYDANREVHSTYIKAGALQEIVYPTGGSLKLSLGPNVKAGTVYAPGLRVDKTELLNANNQVVNTKEFEYYDLKGKATPFPAYAIRQQIVASGFVFEPLTWTYSSEFNAVLPELPNNFFYEKVVIKEKGSGGNDAVTVEFFKDPADDGNHFGTMLNNGHYQPRLYKRELYKDSYLAANLIKEELYEFAVSSDVNTESVIFKLFPSVLTNTYLDGDFNTLYSCLNYSTGLDDLYFLRSKWINLQSEVSKEFTSSGWLTSNKTYEYASSNHGLPSKIIATNSDGKKRIQNFKYPLDFNVGTSPTNNIAKGIRLLQTKNIIGEIAEYYSQESNADGSNLITTGGVVNTFKPTTPVGDKAYSLTIGGPITNYTPASITGTSFTLDSRYREAVSYNLYDARSNILEQQRINDLKEVYLWGYDGYYPVAKVIGSDYATVSGLISQTILNNTNGVVSDNDMRTELNKIRTGLVNTTAQVFTYTYRPLVGITSETDPNGRTTYYEYDQFGRLNLVKDKDGKVVKKLCYNYAGQAENCLVYYNVVKSGSFTRNNCGSGYAGSSVSYTVPAGTYTSSISQAAADALAQNDVNTNGQTYANTNGTCTVSEPTWTISAQNNTAASFTAAFTNKTTNITTYFLINYGVYNLPIGSLPHGVYDITITPTSSSDLFEWYVGGYPLLGYNVYTRTWATIDNHLDIIIYSWL